MMSAASMSAQIRAKKKKLEEESDAVKLSGIPEDATDALITKHKEPGEEMSENMPKEHEEDPTLAALMAKAKSAQPHDEMAPDPKLDMDDGKPERMKKIGRMMRKMGK